MEKSLSQLPWLWQWREVRDLARHLIKYKQSPDYDIQNCLLDCELGEFPKAELEKRLMDIIFTKIDIIDNPDGKYKQLELL